MINYLVYNGLIFLIFSDASPPDLAQLTVMCYQVLHPLPIFILPHFFDFALQFANPSI